MTEKKEQNKPTEIETEVAQELESEELDEAHGGAGFITTGPTSFSLGQTGTPLALTIDARFDLNADTAYGGIPDILTPLKR